MSSFKSGSGNLDFGGSDSDEKADQSAEDVPSDQEEADVVSTSEADSVPVISESTESESEDGADQLSAYQNPAEAKSEPQPSPETYPYFIRRRNVGDERDTRLEIHVRDEVADQEGQYRTRLAEELGASEVSKTDAREFALLAAFKHPDRVAKLMREEGFGALD
ncbi:acyl-CoA dehydrogenase [Natronorarus salvus]|uniref:acyl-CoA dehydrogenase n=1 Tax=Natronorarus salvus TaxID=3117733 RepID=UPI002F268F49